MSGRVWVMGRKGNRDEEDEAIDTLERLRFTSSFMYVGGEMDERWRYLYNNHHSVILGLWSLGCNLSEGRSI